MPSRTHPLWPAKLAMHSFAADYYYFTEHPPYEYPGYAPGDTYLQLVTSGHYLYLVEVLHMHAPFESSNVA